MSRNTKLKLAAGTATVAAGIAGGLAFGPAGAVWLGALAMFLTGLYHETPAQRETRTNQEKRSPHHAQQDAEDPR